MKNIAKKLDVSFDVFMSEYVVKVNYRFSLKEKELRDNDFSCIFFQDDKCSIYEVRPSQCIKFPFWDSFKNKKKEELEYLKKECIGVRFE